MISVNGPSSHAPPSRSSLLPSLSFPFSFSSDILCFLLLLFSLLLPFHSPITSFTSSFSFPLFFSLTSIFRIRLLFHFLRPFCHLSLLLPSFLPSSPSSLSDSTFHVSSSIIIFSAFFS